MAWKAGDECWRGYARQYHPEGKGQPWWPEIRPAKIRQVHPDGLVDVVMRGCLPSYEGRRNPGTWIARCVDPASLHRTPEAALRKAKRIAIDANAEEQTETA